ncbi:histone-lysine N-methyltransferase SETMAR [Trichonephila clavipes]|nr:histone-lysine N-methyltransferase SETMAR [Trichonephila clavipes]
MRFIWEKKSLTECDAVCTQNGIAFEIDYMNVINDIAMTKAGRKLVLFKYNDSESTKNKDVENFKLQGVKMEVNKEKIRFFLQFFFDKGENASLVAEIVNGVYGADTVTANYVQFWFRRLGSEIIEVDRHVSSSSIAQELKIDHKTVLSHLRKVGLKKKGSMFGGHINYTKKHDRSNFHLRSLGQRNEIDPFLKRMVTGDEKWVTYYNIV